MNFIVLELLQRTLSNDFPARNTVPSSVLIHTKGNELLTLDCIDIPLGYSEEHYCLGFTAENTVK